MRLLSVAVLSVVLCGCGGGSSRPVVDAPSTSNPQTPRVDVPGPSHQVPPPHPPVEVPPPVGNPPPTAQKVVIEYYGDSIVWGWDGSAHSSDDWVRVPTPAPRTFADRLGYAYLDGPQTSPPSASSVVNMGTPGRLSEDALEGTWPFEPWESLMRKSPATHVVLEYHSHDSVENVTSRLRQMIVIAKDNGKKVTVETIGPGNHSGNLTWPQISGAQREAARLEGVPVIDQSSYLEGYMAVNGLQLYDIAPDALHPDQGTYTLKGEYAASQFVE